MKILYLSCHEVLEADEVTLFRELGHEVFSPGAYVEPRITGDLGLRPHVPLKTDWERGMVKRFGGVDKNALTPELLAEVDCTVVMHMPDWIERNWKVLKTKRVVWRTIGQSVQSVEQRMAPFRNAGMQIVRYSPRESNIPDYIGGDKIIRFYKDPDVYKGWIGDQEHVVNFTQHMEERGAFCGWDIWKQVTKGFPRKLFGGGSEHLNYGYGTISHEQQIEELRHARCYFYHGTHPASYTLSFIEAMMTGIPIVAVGPQHGNADVWRNHDLYEVPDLIQGGVSGFTLDSIPALRQQITRLRKDRRTAQRIGKNARRHAVSVFGRATACRKWKSFLV